MDAGRAFGRVSDLKRMDKKKRSILMLWIVWMALSPFLIFIDWVTGIAPESPLPAIGNIDWAYIPIAAILMAFVIASFAIHFFAEICPGCGALRGPRSLYCSKCGRKLRFR